MEPLPEPLMFPFGNENRHSRDNTGGLTMPSSVVLTVPPDHHSSLHFVETELQHRIARNLQEVVWIRKVTPKLYLQLISESSPVRRLRFWYNFTENTIRVTMPSLMHDSLAAQMSELIANKLRGLDAWNTACVPNLSPSIRFGDTAAQPDGCFGPINSENITVVVEVGVSQSQSELDKDARFWLESAQSLIEICFTVKLIRPGQIIVSVFRSRSQMNPSHQLLSLQESSVLTDEVAITRRGSGMDPLVKFQDPLQTEVSIPVTAFCSHSLPPGVTVNLQSNLVFTSQDFVNYGNLHWVKANGY